DDAHQPGTARIVQSAARQQGIGSRHDFPLPATHGIIKSRVAALAARSKGSRAMTIAAILQNKGHEVVTVEVGTSVRDAIARLAERRIGAMPVCDGGRVAGIMSERDIIYRL